MPLFKKKDIKINEVFISRWEDLPYFLLATEWDISTGLCENWDPKLKRAEPLKVIECLRLLPSEKEQECTMMDQRGWILSAYHKAEEAKLKLVEKKSKLEKELCDLQGWLSTL